MITASTFTNRWGYLVSVCLACALIAGRVMAWSPLAVVEDPLVRMPGTQPGQVQLEEPGQCFNCHGDYDAATEPGAWKGSMMGQAARDPLFWAAMTVAAQDSIWALGRPNATDLCLRCHFPQGWLEERSDPVNASLMQGADYDGVHCGFCHRTVDPFYEATNGGTREGSDWAGYWDESNLSGTPSDEAALATYPLDVAAMATIDLFNGTAFLDPATHLPKSPEFQENASGQYFVDPSPDRRGPFADANASHARVYSRYHKSRYYCSTCHDVSNPVLANLDFEGTLPADGETVLPSEAVSSFQYGHVERTFSEFMLSAFGQPGGAAGSGAFAPDVFTTSLENNYVARCQDCHMADVRGEASSQSRAVLRPDGSVEHPKSGVPAHDLTGGNFWVPWVLASTVQGSSNYDAENQAILGQGSAVLTLDLEAGLGLDPDSLLAAADRALATLGKAATIEEVEFDEQSRTVSFQVRNHTGHKLLSGFPEGRRAWVNVRVFDAENALIAEINPYDAGAATLKGLDYSYHDPDSVLPAPADLAEHEHHEDAIVYEMLPSSSMTGEEHSFHFVLADARYKDNRIPPRGFDSEAASTRLSEPAWSGASAPGFFTAEEYAGGYDEIEVAVDPAARRVEMRLFYQTTSREYVEFLRDEINGTADSLPGAGVAGDAAYLVQTDSFFDRLRAWGDAVWQLWRHNRSVPGAAPIQMAAAILEISAVAEPAIDIEKATNGFDADVEPGPYIAVDEPVEWSYVVTNTGNVELNEIAVVDDQGVTVDCPASGLEAGAAMTCLASGVAIAGQYANIGTVTGVPEGGGEAVSDSDPSHYFGMIAAIDIEKATNGFDADVEPGPYIAVNESIEWTYVVTNTGNVKLNGIAVVDDQGATVDCPASELEAGAAMTCLASGVAIAGQYANIGTVTGVPEGGGEAVSDSDPSHYFGMIAAIDIEKATNGFDADVEPGPVLTVGDPVNWTYFVRNTSNVTITGVVVTDDQGVAVSCLFETLLAAGEMTCTGSGTVQEGQYRNVGTVTAQPPAGPTITDSDPSHYLGTVSADLIFQNGFE